MKMNVGNWLSFALFMGLAGMSRNMPCNHPVSTTFHCAQEDGEDLCQIHCDGQPEEEHICGWRCGPEDMNVCSCLCRFVEGRCVGEPHYQTFDGIWHHWQGLCKYIIVKPCRFPLYVPYYEVTGINRPYPGPNGRVSAIDTVELHVPVWDLDVKITDEGIFIDDERVQLPLYLKYTESFFGYVSMRRFHTFYIVETSFGVTLWKAGFDLRVRIPQDHSDYFGNTCGMLGSYDGNRTNDLTDREGTLHENDNWVWDFGNSWCTACQPGGREEDQEECEQIKKSQKKTAKKAAKKDAKIEQKCTNSGRKEKIEALCEDLRRPDLEHCRAELMEDADQDFNNCVFDLCHLGKNEAKWENYVITRQANLQTACMDLEVANAGNCDE